MPSSTLQLPPSQSTRARRLGAPSCRLAIPPPHALLFWIPTPSLELLYLAASALCVKFLKRVRERKGAGEDGGEGRREKRWEEKEERRERKEERERGERPSTLPGAPQGFSLLCPIPRGGVCLLIPRRQSFLCSQFEP